MPGTNTLAYYENPLIMAVKSFKVQAPVMVRPIGSAPICLSLDEVAVLVGHEGLMELTYFSPIVGDPQRILNQQLGSRPMHLLNIALKLNNYI